MSQPPPPIPSYVGTRKRKPVIVGAILAILVVAVIIIFALFGSMGQHTASNVSPSPTISQTPTPYSTPTTSINTPTIKPSPMVTPTPTNKSVTISYTMVTKQSFVWIDSIGTSQVQQADSGKVFLEVDMTIKNNGYDRFDTNPYYFKAFADDVKYTVDIYTYYQHKWDIAIVLNGETFGGTLLFQIPESASSYAVSYEAVLSNYNIIWTKT
jgi:hypothetical protein